MTHNPRLPDSVWSKLRQVVSDAYPGEYADAGYLLEWLAKHGLTVVPDPGKEQHQPIVWTEEMEAERLRLCQYFVQEADSLADAHSGSGVLWPEMARNCLLVEECLTILGDIARVASLPAKTGGR